MFRATPAASEANVKRWGPFEIETYLRWPSASGPFSDLRLAVELPGFSWAMSE
jgi:hypothetical protein